MSRVFVVAAFILPLGSIASISSVDPPASFVENFNRVGASEGWELDGLWGVDRTQSGAHREEYASWHNTLNYNNYMNHFDTGERTLGTATSPEIDMRGIAPRFRVRFSCTYDSETEEDYDLRRLRILYGEYRTILRDWYLEEETTASIGSCGGRKKWHDHQVDLTLPMGMSYSEKNVLQLEFSFDSVDEVENRGRGWFVDDIKIASLDRTDPPSKNVTVYFTNFETYEDLDSLLPEHTGLWSRTGKLPPDLELQPDSYRLGGRFAQYTGLNEFYWPNEYNFELFEENEEGAVTSLPNTGVLRTKVIKLRPNRKDYWIHFWCLYETEDTGDDWDRRQVIVRNAEGESIFETTLAGMAADKYRRCGDMLRWHQHRISPWKVGGVVPNEGDEITVEFRFDTVDGWNNRYAGWFLRNLKVAESRPIEQE